MDRSAFAKAERYSALFVLAACVICHFLYRLTGENPLVGLFCPVSESVWEHGKLLESYTLDFSTGHRSEKAPSMLAMVKDIICEECMPLVNSVRRNAAVWDGDIKVKEA